MPSAVLIVNRSSGHHLNADEHKGGSEALLRDLGFAVETAGGSIRRQISKARRSSADIVVVDGGDGTLNAVVGALGLDGRPIGLIPGGTMNLIAADYGVPLDRQAAAESIAGGQSRAIDAATMGGRLFLHTAFTGLPVRIGVHREARRGAMGLITKARLAVHAFTSGHKDETLSLREPSAADAISGESFVFGVGDFVGQIMPRPERVAVNDGRMTAIAIRPKNSADLARLLVRGAFGTLLADEAVTRRELGSGTLTGRRRGTHAMLDGESVFVRLPAEIVIRKGAWRLFVPHPGTGAAA
ncbi:MAG: diacylglycerol kinase family protein [Pseudomonadota bacterium]